MKTGEHSLPHFFLVMIKIAVQFLFFQFMKRFWAYVLAVLAVLLLGAYLFVVVAPSKNQTVLESKETGGVFLIQPNQYDITYTNIPFHYSVTLSRSWYFSQESSADSLAFFDWRVFEKGITDSELIRGMKMNIVAENVGESFSIDDKAKEITNESSSASIESTQVTVDGHPAVRLVDTMFGYSIITLVKNKQTIFEIIGWIAEPDQKERYLQEYGTILSTVHFLD